MLLYPHCREVVGVGKYKRLFCRVGTEYGGPVLCRTEYLLYWYPAHTVRVQYGYSTVSTLVLETSKHHNVLICASRHLLFIHHGSGYYDAEA